MGVTYNEQNKTLTFSSKDRATYVARDLLSLAYKIGLSKLTSAERVVFDLDAADNNNYSIFLNLALLNEEGTPVIFKKVKMIVFGPKLKRIGEKDREVFVVYDLFPNVKEISILGETELGCGLFSGLRDIKISMPKVTLIADDCFQNTTFASTKLFLPQTLKQLKRNVFKYSNIQVLYFNGKPDYVNAYFLGNTDDSKIKKIIVPNFDAFNTIFLHSFVENSQHSQYPNQFTLKVEIQNKDDIDRCKERYHASSTSNSSLQLVYNIIDIKADILKTAIFED